MYWHFAQRNGILSPYSRKKYENDVPLQRKSMSKKRIRLKGRLRIYMQTSLYLGLLLLLVDVGTYFLDVRAGFLLSTTGR